MPVTERAPAQTDLTKTVPGYIYLSHHALLEPE